MPSPVNASLLSSLAEHRERFRTARPFPHLVIDSFFEPSFCTNLLGEFPPFERGCATNEQGLPGAKATVQDIRSLGPTFARADDVFRSPEFAAFMSELTGIPGLTYDPEYIGGGTHENLPGQELDPHVDFNHHPRTGWHRRLNLIIYLNHEWAPEWGGALELHQDPWQPPEKNRIEHVLPLLNRAVVFETSERSWHGFEAIRPPPGAPRTSRKSLALYMYTEDRPAAEKAPPHSTVYVERPLPFVLRPGGSVTYAQISRISRAFARRRQHVARLQERENEFATRIAQSLRELLARGEPLTQDHIDALGRALAREDSRLRILYDREKDYTADLAVVDALLGTGARQGLPVLGKGRLTSPPRGYFEDRWCGPKVELDVSTTGPVSGVVLHGYIPERLREGQRVTVSVGDQAVEQELRPGLASWNAPISIPADEAVSVVLAASACFQPSRDDAGSPDTRDLAYQLFGVELL